MFGAAAYIIPAMLHIKMKMVSTGSMVDLTTLLKQADSVWGRTK